MATTDDLRKTITDATPLYAAVGTVDLAAEKLREVPALIEKIRAEAPERFESVLATDPKAVQERVTHQAKEAQNKVSDVLGTLDTDLKKLRETAQDIALQGVGRAAEYAVKARETYDELAERGRGAVQTWRGETAGQVEEIAVAIEPEAKDSPKDSKESAASTAPQSAAAAKPAPAKKTAAKKTAPRKNTQKSSE